MIIHKIKNKFNLADIMTKYLSNNRKWPLHGPHALWMLEEAKQRCARNIHGLWQLHPDPMGSPYNHRPWLHWKGNIRLLLLKKYQSRGCVRISAPFSANKEECHDLHQLDSVRVSRVEIIKSRAVPEKHYGAYIKYGCQLLNCYTNLTTANLCSPLHEWMTTIAWRSLVQFDAVGWRGGSWSCPMNTHIK